MEIISFDILQCIMNMIDFVDVNNLLVTCKPFFLYRTSVYYKSEKQKYCNPNELFTIVDIKDGNNFGFGKHECDIYNSNGIKIASLWNNMCSEYIISIDDEILSALNYPKIAKQVFFPPNVLKKIEYRFYKLTIEDISPCHECPSFIVAVGNNDVRWSKIMYHHKKIIKQCKLLYYTLKYYHVEIKSEILKINSFVDNCNIFHLMKNYMENIFSISDML